VADAREVDYPSRCPASAGHGDHVCCLPDGHEGWHESRLFGDPDGSLWASWNDRLGDPDPCACAHEEMEHQPPLPAPAGARHEVVRCTRCGRRYFQIEDEENATTTLTSFEGGRWVNRRIRYEEVPF